MPSNKYALLRYRIIDRCISNRQRPFPSKEDLRRACEEALYGSDGDQISLSTIDKDLWAMRNEGDLGYYAPIAYSKLEKGYYYEDPDFTINDINLNDEDLAALNLAAETLVQFRDIPLFRQYHHAIDKVVSRLRVSRDPNDRAGDAFIQFEEAPEVKGLEHLEPLLHAIRNHKAIHFRYQKFNDQEPSDRTVHPYLLKEYRNRWYLISWEPENQDYRTYALDRITEVRSSDLGFDWRADFDRDRFFQHSIGITELDTAPVQVELLAEPLLGKYMESQPLHRSQTLSWQADGKALISLKVLITFELMAEILSYGSAIEVKSPASLRQRIQENLSKALQRYD